MIIKIKCVWEHNGDDTMLYAEDFPGAFTRGASVHAAMQKMPSEIRSYLRWSGKYAPDAVELEIVQEKRPSLSVSDADSDVLFEEERKPLRMPDDLEQKALALKSARDFQRLYQAIPDKHKSCLPVRTTFYGQVPRAAFDMYEHTKNVNDYYFGEIGVSADHEGTIVTCRERGFALLEKQPDFLENKVCLGSYEEAWSLGKVLRRFIWHDRVHAKAMYRMAIRTFGPDAVPNVFCFDW